MAYQVLARKWRPRTFSEVIGQDHIARTLQNSVLKNKIAQAYLFTGTRGVGKTTIARIFAKAIRCENLDEQGNPCLECPSCKGIDQANALDYVEIDGASNNSVDDIRELIENAQYLPSSGRFKVYVVDEVHMLSTSAFNALLKTLEEPPAHVVFIFATTDPHKLLGTVLSRCQRFDFKHVTEERLAEHVKQIAAKENITFTSDDSVRILARQGNGSVRDTLSLMDQALSLSSGEEISEETLLQSLGLARADAIKELASCLLAKNSKEALSLFDEITLDSVELEKLSNQILDRLFEVIEHIDDSQALGKLLSNAAIADDLSSAEIMWIYEVLLKDFEWSLQSFDPLRALRFALLKVCRRDEIVGKGPSISKKKSKSLAPDQTPEQPSVEASASEPEEEVPEEIREKKQEEIKEEIQEEVEEQSEAPSEAAYAALDEAAAAIEQSASEHKANGIHSEEDVAEKPAIPLPDPSEEKSWSGFMAFLREHSRGIGMNLERGNLMSPAVKGATEIVVGFIEDEKIFLDFLTEPESLSQLNDLTSAYFTDGQASSRITIKIIDEETRERENLSSTVELEEKKISDIKAAKEENIRSNKYIKEAEALFNGQISKIILNEEDK